MLSRLLNEKSTALRLNSLISPPGLFRISLAYIVVIDHFTPIQLGGSAVFLFFMLSGFWVFQMWGREYAPTTAPFTNFVISRMWRLLPVYFVAVAATMSVYLWFHDYRMLADATHGWSSLHFILSHLFIIGYATLPMSAKIIPPVWSLDIELQFYITAPLIIAAVTQYKWLSWQRLTLYALAVVGLIVYVTFYMGPHAVAFPQTAFLPMYLIFFLIGLHSAKYNWTPRPAIALAGLCTALLLIGASILIPATRSILFYHKSLGPLIAYNAELNIVIALLIAPYAMATVKKQMVKGSRIGRLDRDLSNITYEIYLLHVCALSIVSHLFGGLSRHARLPIIIGAWVILLILSWAVYRFFDKPIDGRRGAWVKSRPRKQIFRPVSVQMAPKHDPSVATSQFIK